MFNVTFWNNGLLIKHRAGPAIIDPSRCSVNKFIRDANFATIILASMMVAWPAPAMGEKFRDSTGISFSYPDSWIAVTKPVDPIKQANLPPKIHFI